MRKKRNPIKRNFKNFNMQLFENPSQPPFTKGRNNIPLSGFSLPQAGKRGIHPVR
jgi:hypothetical protein